MRRRCLRRRGHPPEALVAFCKHVGVAKFNSTHEIGLLVTFLSITIILYSTSIYYLEKDSPESPFTCVRPSRASPPLVVAGASRPRSGGAS